METVSILVVPLNKTGALFLSWQLNILIPSLCQIPSTNHLTCLNTPDVRQPALLLLILPLSQSVEQHSSGSSSAMSVTVLPARCSCRLLQKCLAAALTHLHTWWRFNQARHLNKVLKRGKRAVDVTEAVDVVRCESAPQDRVEETTA